MRWTLIPILILALAMSWGCGSMNDTTLAQTDEAQVTEATLFAAPPEHAKNDKNDKSNKTNTTDVPVEDIPIDEIIDVLEPIVYETVHFEGEQLIPPLGGQIQFKPYGNGRDQTKLIFPGGAVKKDTLITMSMVTDFATFVEFEFGPHGTQFRVPVMLDLSWDALPNNVKEDDVVLLYWNNGEWQPEETGQWLGKDKKVRIELDHFSRYYFERR